MSKSEDTKEENDRDKELASFKTLEVRKCREKILCDNSFFPFFFASVFAESSRRFQKKQGVDTRKMLTIVNHFVTTTTGFFNRLSRISEERLQKVSRDITRIDVKLKVLEAKLASIKGLESTTADAVPVDSKTEQKEADPSGASAQTSQDDEMVELNSKTCSAVYTKFFKMIEMMIPLEAVKLKCASAGLDPTLLDKFGQKVHVSIAQGNASPSNNSAGAAALKDDDDRPVTGTEIVPVDQTKVEEEDDAPPAMKLKDDPAYKAYFRMMKIRVPTAHIKAKMAAHGLDPSIIDMDPDGPSPSSGTSVPVAAIEDNASS